MIGVWARGLPWRPEEYGGGEACGGREGLGAWRVSRVATEGRASPSSIMAAPCRRRARAGAWVGRVGGPSGRCRDGRRGRRRLLDHAPEGPRHDRQDVDRDHARVARAWRRPALRGERPHPLVPPERRLPLQAGRGPQVGEHGDGHREPAPRLGRRQAQADAGGPGRLDGDVESRGASRLRTSVAAATQGRPIGRRSVRSTRIGSTRIGFAGAWSTCSGESRCDARQGSATASRTRSSRAAPIRNLPPRPPPRGSGPGRSPLPPAGPRFERSAPCRHRLRRPATPPRTTSPGGPARSCGAVADSDVET